MNPKITVVTVNYNSAPFIENALYALNELSHNEIRIHVCDNGSRWYDRRRLKRVVGHHQNASITWRTQESGHSEAHGTALNLLLEEVETPYALLLDADASVLVDGWDELLLGRLDGTTKVIGAPPVENPIKPTDFPSVYLTLVEMESFRALDIDMRPADPSTGKDTGWELRDKYLDAGYEAECLTTKNTRNYRGGPFAEVLCAEFYLRGVAHILGSHFGRGSSLGAAKYFKSSIFHWPIVGAIPKWIRGYLERRNWIRTCRELVDDQRRSDW